MKKGESFTLTEELDNTELSFTQDAKSVSGSIMGTDGDSETLTGIKYGESWSTVLSSVDKSNDVKFAFGTDDKLTNMTSSNPNYIDLNGGTVTNDQIKLAEEKTVISRYYPVEVVDSNGGSNTEYHKLGSSISAYYSEANGHFVSNTKLSGNVTDKISVTEVSNGRLYVYEIVKITFDPDGNGKISGSTSAYVMKYIKGSNVTDAPEVTANSGLTFKNWHTALTAADNDATYYAVYSLGTPSWATKEVLVGYRDDGSSRYTIGDFINKGTDNNTKYYLSNGDSASQLNEDSFDELYSTAVTADVASWKMSTYYYIDITGTAPDNTDIITGGAYFKDSSNIELPEVGYSWYVDSSEQTSHVLEVNSSLAGKTVEIKPWTFTYIFKTPSTRDAIKNQNGIALKVIDKATETVYGSSNGTTDSIEIQVTYGENSNLSNFVGETPLGSDALTKDVPVQEERLLSS